MLRKVTTSSVHNVELGREGLVAQNKPLNKEKLLNYMWISNMKFIYKHANNEIELYCCITSIKDEPDSAQGKNKLKQLYETKHDIEQHQGSV